MLSSFSANKQTNKRRWKQYLVEIGVGSYDMQSNVRSSERW